MAMPRSMAAEKIQHGAIEKPNLFHRHQTPGIGGDAGRVCT